MNEVIEPGTRVRSTEDQYPNLTEGTYALYVEGDPWPHRIKWDGNPSYFRETYMHSRDEFEVIS